MNILMLKEALNWWIKNSIFCISGISRFSFLLILNILILNKNGINRNFYWLKRYFTKN